MKHAGKWLIAASALVILGAGLFAAVMAANDWNLSRLSTEEFETNTYEIREDFSRIDLTVETADILFALSDDGGCRVVCRELAEAKHSVSVQNGALTVTAKDQRKWYEHIGINLESPRVTVYLPGPDYASLRITGSTGSITVPAGFSFGRMDLSLSTGDIRLCGLSAGELDLTVSTGDVDIESVSCGSLTTTGSTGDITLKNVITKGTLTVKRSTGDVRLEACDAGELTLETSTGSVTGSLLSAKIFLAHSNTGDVDVPDTATGGKCKISTSTGDIRITLVKK